MLTESCKEQFGTASLYEVLHLEKGCSSAEVKKAYYKQSMKWHPDRFSSAEATEEQRKNATVKFQVLSKVYGILFDKEKRELYDETGAIDEENTLSGEGSFQDAINIWRKIFKKVTLEDIEKFVSEYKGTDDERGDIKESYQRWKGDFNRIMEDIMGATSEEEERYKEIIEDLISRGELKSTKKYKDTTGTKTTNMRKRKANKEAKEAEEALEEIKKKEGDGDLRSLILARQSARASNMDSMYDQLAAKYSQPKKKKAKGGK